MALANILKINHARLALQALTLSQERPINGKAGTRPVNAGTGRNDDNKGAERQGNNTAWRRQVLGVDLDLQK